MLIVIDYLGDVDFFHIDWIAANVAFGDRIAVGDTLALPFVVHELISGHRLQVILGNHNSSLFCW